MAHQNIRFDLRGESAIVTEWSPDGIMTVKLHRPGNHRDRRDIELWSGECLDLRIFSDGRIVILSHGSMPAARAGEDS
jgi:hypothetical protein